jgi:integrase
MLRRTYATWLLYYGQPLPDVSKNLGHSHTSTTANSYTMATKKGAAMTNRIFKRLLVKK